MNKPKSASHLAAALIEGGADNDWAESIAGTAYRDKYWTSILRSALYSQYSAVSTAERRIRGLEAVLKECDAVKADA